MSAPNGPRHLRPVAAVLWGMAGIVLAVTVIAVASRSSDGSQSGAHTIQASATATPPPTSPLGLTFSP